MGSYSMEEFLGDGVLKGIVPKLVDGGWNDVPTLKVINLEDMDLMKLTEPQKDALEIRSYLHDRFLMAYADRLETSRKSLSELLTLSTSVLSSQFGMKRVHIARFIDRGSTCRVSLPTAYALPARQTTTSSVCKSIHGNDPSVSSRKMRNVRSTLCSNSKCEGATLEQSMLDFKVDDNYVFKGILAAGPAEPRLCCWVQPPRIVDFVAPYSSIEHISVHKLTPEYKVGMEHSVATKAPPMKASYLWNDKPVILLCVRRPGCIMCRAEAYQLYARKPIFDALGFQLIVVLHEHIESEVKELWPRYWGGVVIVDRNKEFFKALGGGKLHREKFVTGFLLNPHAIANYKRAKATGLEHNSRGDGEIKGGLFVIGQGKSGVAYQFIERNFGDWAPITEIIEICSQMQKSWSGKGESLLRS